MYPSDFELGLNLQCISPYRSLKDGQCLCLRSEVTVLRIRRDTEVSGFQVITFMCSEEQARCVALIDIFGIFSPLILFFFFKQKTNLVWSFHLSYL